MDADTAMAFGADEIVVATGSRPAGTGFQRGFPSQDSLPGVERDGVLSVEDVLAGTADVGQRVVVLDDDGDWRGGGTAWHLAEGGHEVVIVTRLPDGRRVDPTHGRRRCAARPVGAARRDVAHRSRCCPNGPQPGRPCAVCCTTDRTTVAADTLVLATTNVPDWSVADALVAAGGRPPRDR